MVRQNDYAKELAGRIVGALDSIASGDRHRMSAEVSRAIQDAIDDAKLLRLELEKPLPVDCGYTSPIGCKHFYRGTGPYG